MGSLDVFAAHPMPTGIIVDGRWRSANAALERLLDRRDLVGMPAVHTLVEAERAALGDHYLDRAGTHAAHWVRRDGTTVAVEVASATAILDGTTSLIVTATDVSRCEVLLDRLVRSEADFRALLDASPTAMYVCRDAAHAYELLWANAAMVRVLGRDDPTCFVGRSADTFVHPDDCSRLIEYRRHLETGDAPPVLALRWVCRDGTIRHIEGTRHPLVFGELPAALVIARDRTDELARERALHESEASYRLLFEGSPLPIAVFDSETFRYVAVNNRMTDVYGYSCDEFLAMTVKDIKPPEDVAKMVTKIAGAPIGSAGHIGVVRHRHKDGRMLDMDITSHQLELAGRKCSLAIAIDVTELRRTEDQLRQAQKMEAVGQLAGGVAHDFNNMLSVVLSAAEFLREELGDDARFTREIADVESAALRGVELTRQLLAFSRKQPHAPVPISLNACMSGVEKLARRIVGEDIAIETRLATDLGTVHADAGQLEQVVMNLIVNARDAMPSGGALVLETRNIELAGVDAEGLGVSQGRYVQLAVSDTGCGMDPATRARIFEPFFTTKEVGKGTGLGLATVFGIVKQHHGSVAVYSEVDRGSTFRVFLPRIDQPMPRSRPSERSIPRYGTETILLVEDDAQLRRTVLRHLQAFGYRIVEAGDPVSALELAQTDARIDLLLTDLVMPTLDGRALASRLLGTMPALKVLFMSGYSEHAAVTTTQLGPHDHFIAKPFTAADLSVAVRRALEVAC